MPKKAKHSASPFLVERAVWRKMLGGYALALTTKSQIISQSSTKSTYYLNWRL